MSYAKQNLDDTIAKLSKFIFVGLLVYVPFHVLASTWIGLSIGQLEIAKAVKDPLMIFGFALIIYAERKSLKNYFKKDKWLYIALFSYFAFTCLSVLLFANNTDAEILGTTYNLRFLCFFIYGTLLINRYNNGLKFISINLVLITGMLVAIFGILQVLILPNDALSKIGYSKSTGNQQVFFINDETQSTERASSTIKDPNSLGSYLLIITALYLAYLFTSVKSADRWIKGVLLLTPLSLCLYLTYSRSAWLGFMFGIAFLLYYILSRNKRLTRIVKNKIPIILVCLVAVVISLFAIGFTKTNLYRNVVLHDELNQSVDSNTKRLDSYIESINLIKQNPLFGTGVGSAGPVSYKNSPKTPVISENYYLQIAVETGLLMLVIFIFVVLVVAVKLYRASSLKNLYPLALLCALVGISVASMFNHIWANEAVAYTWWGLASLFIAKTKSNNI